jgi:hypothetical protein
MIIFAISTDFELDPRRGNDPGAAQGRLYWMPAVGLAEEVVLARVRKPICNMNAWLSTGGVTPAEYW